MDYETATERWNRSRQYKHVGVKLRSRLYMIFDVERGCFIVQECWSRHEMVEKDGVKRWVSAPRERWDMRPCAEIHPDKIVITRDFGNSQMQWLFGLSSYKSRTVKYSGREWHCLGQVAYGDLPVELSDGAIRPQPPKVRVVDNEKRKEMNRMIQKIRNLLKVRVKLGAFQNVDMKQVHEQMRLEYGNKWLLYQTNEGFLQILHAVREDDIETFYPILWLADANYYHPSHYNKTRDWVGDYNRFINRIREKLRKGMGVVEYVEETKHD